MSVRGDWGLRTWFDHVFRVIWFRQCMDVGCVLGRMRRSFFAFWSLSLVPSPFNVGFKADFIGWRWLVKVPEGTPVWRDILRVWWGVQKVAVGCFNCDGQGGRESNCFRFEKVIWDVIFQGVWWRTGLTAAGTIPRSVLEAWKLNGRWCLLRGRGAVGRLWWIQYGY